MGAVTAMMLLADTTGDAAAGSTIGTFLPLIAIGAIMYFLLIRPQRKRQKDQQQLIEKLTLGADVVTIGGMHGTIEELGEDWVDLVVDGDGTVLRFQRQAIARTLGAEVTADDVDTEE